MSREPRSYLDDIRECCQKVMRYAQGMTLVQLAKDEETYDAIMRNLEIAGEAIRHIPTEIQGRYPEVEWRNIAGFRDVAIHAYPTIDEEIVWDIVQNKVPQPLRQVEAILQAEFGGKEP